MRIEIKNYETKEVICNYQKDVKSFTEAMQDIKMEQEVNNILKLEEPGSFAQGFSYGGLGIVSIFDNETYASSTINDDACVVYSGGAMSIGDNSSVKPKEPTNIVVETENGKKEIPLKLEINIYLSGFLISIGKKGDAAMFCAKQVPLYFNKKTKTHVKYGPAEAAKKFKSLKALYLYLLKEKDMFSFLCKSSDAVVSWNYASDDFQKEIEKTLHDEKNNKAFNEVKLKLETLLDEINEKEEVDNCVAEEAEQLNLPENASIDEMKAEAINRLTEMKVIPTVITHFKKDELYYSEFNGMIYNLNEDANKALKEVKDSGYLPYHVIRSETSFGDLYAVLYVTFHAQDNWTNGERVDKNGYVFAYVYNATHPELSEFGEIQIKPSNGGIQRIS
ncbi:MAG: hypothetical protein RSC93_03180 [Erysipelotrichaceae bacterium]